MYHGAHRFKSHRSLRHITISAALILIPIGVLFALGSFTNVPWPVLGGAIGISLWRLLTSYLISLIIGVALALVVGNSKYGDDILPIFDVLQNIPSFALIPVFIALLGSSSTMIIAFSATAIIWPIMFYVASAIHGAHEELNDAATILGARGWRRVVYYTLPLSFPALVTGSIVGVSIGWEAVIGAEIIARSTGIGTFLTNAGNNGQQSMVTVGIVALLVVVFIISRVVWLPLLKQIKIYAD
jgi:ABC-type nitrate/sulfonate/bicarbonate transport system permease component